MDSPWIKRYVVRGLDLTPNTPRRWTFGEAELKFRLKDIANRKLRVDFVVIEETFRVTGPFEIEFRVNDRSAGRFRCNRPGEYSFEAPVPKEFLEYRPETRLKLVMDKYWVAPSDGNKLGVQLVRAGFKSQ